MTSPCALIRELTSVGMSVAMWHKWQSRGVKCNLLERLICVNNLEVLFSDTNTLFISCKQSKQV